MNQNTIKLIIASGLLSGLIIVSTYIFSYAYEGAFLGHFNIDERFISLSIEHIMGTFVLNLVLIGLIYFFIRGFLSKLPRGKIYIIDYTIYKIKNVWIIMLYIFLLNIKALIILFGLSIIMLYFAELVISVIICLLKNKFFPEEKNLFKKLVLLNSNLLKGLNLVKTEEKPITSPKKNSFGQIFNNKWNSYLSLIFLCVYMLFLAGTLIGGFYAKNTTAFDTIEIDSIKYSIIYKESDNLICKKSDDIDGYDVFIIPIKEGVYKITSPKDSQYMKIWKSR